MQKTKISIKNMTTVSACSIGVITGLIVTVLLILIGVLCISNEYIKLQNIGVIAALIQFVAVLVACIVAGKVTSNNQIVCCAATCCVYYLSSVASSLLFFDGVSSAALIGVIATILGFAASLFIVLGRKKRSARRKIKRQSR